MASPAANTTRPRVLIIGAGFGGLYAARALRHADAEVIVIDRRNHHLFQPLLYQVATAGLSPGDIAAPIRAVLARQKNTRVLLEEVTAIDLAERQAKMREDALRYDYLILATGASHAYFGHDEWEKFAPGLKTLEDALEIRRRILFAFEKAERETDDAKRGALLTFVIVGGGPTGVELAGAIAEISRRVMVRDFRAIDPRAARIVLIEAGPRILPAYPEDLSAAAEAQLKRLGAEVWTHTPVTSLAADQVISGGRSLRASTILWAAGVAASPPALSLGVERDKAGRVFVEPDLSVPGHPEVFVIGDLAAFTHQAGEPLPGVAPVAIQQGRHAARNLLRTIGGKPSLPFHYFNKGNLATIGRAAAVADLGKLKFSGFPAWVAWLSVHIFFLIGFRNRFVVLFDWAWAYFTSQRGARLITGDLGERQRRTDNGRPRL